MHIFAKMYYETQNESCENCFEPATIFCKDRGNSWKSCCQSRHQNERRKNDTLNVIAVKVSQESSQQEEGKEQNEDGNKGSARSMYIYNM